jgi:hypothetical protein
MLLAFGFCYLRVRKRSRFNRQDAMAPRSDEGEGEGSDHNVKSLNP